LEVSLRPLFLSSQTCSVIFAVVAALVIGIPQGEAESPTATGGQGSVVPVMIRIEIGDRSELADLTRLVSIEDVRGSEVLAVATPEQLRRLSEAGHDWRILPPVVKAADVMMCAVGWEDDTGRSWSCYPSYDQYTSIMHRFASDHPTLCRIVDLGAGNNAVRPHRLWAVVISDNPDTDEAEPEVLLTSTMHGDETTGYVLMLRLINHLLMGYGTDTEITSLVDETEIWINPLANPDGAYFGGDDTVSDAIRWYTTTTGGDSGVNPNRNFPDFVLGDHPDGLARWWPETEAMMELAESKTFVLSANFHGGVEVVNYPWDTVERRHPDDLWFQTLSRDWADLAQADSPGGYMTDFDNGITNGYDWYPIHGGRQDFMTFFHGGREVTIELSRTKLLPADELDDLWLWNRRALLDFIAHAQEGIRGIVTDANATPLEAAIEVVGIDREEDGSMVRTDPTVGDFHRLLLPGLYDLRIEAADFQPHEIHGIAVINGEATVVDVVLQRVIRRPSRRTAPNTNTSR
jgi:hypothetical protein